FLLQAQTHEFLLRMVQLHTPSHCLITINLYIGRHFSSYSVIWRATLIVRMTST
ncbi:hypothetical protein L9F63_009781, partial [Diploptera punctata]